MNVQYRVRQLMILMYIVNINRKVISCWLVAMYSAIANGLLFRRVHLTVERFVLHQPIISLNIRICSDCFHFNETKIKETCIYTYKLKTSRYVQTSPKKNQINLTEEIIKNDTQLPF